MGFQEETSTFFDCELNHCTIIIYNTHSPGINYKLPFHYDCEYDHNGTFLQRNSKRENTPVIVYSLGDSRTLNLSRRMAVDSGNHKQWLIIQKKCKEFELKDNSIFLLHPDDENPLLRYFDKELSQFQHGNVQVKKGQLSLGMVLRNVTKSLPYNNVTDVRLLPDNFMNDQRNDLINLMPQWKTSTQIIHISPKPFKTIPRTESFPSHGIVHLMTKISFTSDFI